MQIEGAQAELSANLAQLSNDDTGLAAQGQAQLGSLAALQRQIDGASPMALVMMRASVAASVAASANLAQQARTAASSTAQGAGASLATASAAARATVADFERDMYEKKIFDPYLRFGSKEDEDAYREREAARKRATDEALKQNTPESNLRAANLSIDQLKDAGAHGADQSPDYAPLMQQTTAAKAKLESALDQSKHPAATRDAQLDAAKSQPGLAAATDKIDPATISAFASLVAHTSGTTPDGPGVMAQAKTATVSVARG